jgi:enoyl-CoA hydratase/carnithine racemase
MSSGVRLEHVGATRIVVIDRPESRNALTLEVLTDLRGAFDEAGRLESVRCVVLTGAAGHFCSGADLRRLVSEVEGPPQRERLEAYIDTFHDVVKALVRCPKPTIAMLEGAAVGFGADLAFACDIRVAATSAYVQEKFVKIGLLPDGGGTFWLPRLVGTARAMELILLGEPLTAPALAQLGIALRVVDASALRETTLEVARALEHGPPLAHAAIKRALYASWGSFEEALRRERDEQLKLLESADFAEGVAAWREKRSPHFRGA